MVYNGGTPKYVATIDAAEKDYEGIRFFAESEPPVDITHSQVNPVI